MERRSLFARTFDNGIIDYWLRKDLLSVKSHGLNASDNSASTESPVGE